MLSVVGLPYPVNFEQMVGLWLLNVTVRCGLAAERAFVQNDFVVNKCATAFRGPARQAGPTALLGSYWDRRPFYLGRARPDRRRRRVHGRR